MKSGLGQDKGYNFKLYVYKTCKLNEMEGVSDLFYHMFEIFQISRGKSLTL